MILGIGTDLVEIARMEAILSRHGSRFITRWFTPYEQSRVQSYKTVAAQAAYLAKRFAAKEAFVKALGTGFDGVVGFKDIGVEETPEGRPVFKLECAALKAMDARVHGEGTVRTHLSLTDERAFAQAFVVIEVCL